MNLILALLREAKYQGARGIRLSLKDVWSVRHIAPAAGDVLPAHEPGLWALAASVAIMNGFVSVHLSKHGLLSLPHYFYSLLCKHVFHDTQMDLDTL